MLPICIYRCYLYLIGGTAPNGTGFKMLNMDMTPAQKAARTRLHNKAYAILDQTVEPQYKKWEAELNRFAPIRDRYIAKLEAERDAAIAEINRKFEEDRAIQQAQFEHMMKPAQEAYDKVREEAWVVYRETMKAGA